MLRSQNIKIQRSKGGNNTIKSRNARERIKGNAFKDQIMFQSFDSLIEIEQFPSKGIKYGKNGTIDQTNTYSQTRIQESNQIKKQSIDPVQEKSLHQQYYQLKSAVSTMRSQQSQQSSILNDKIYPSKNGK